MKTVIPVRVAIFLSRRAFIDLADRQDAFSSPKLYFVPILNQQVNMCVRILLSRGNAPSSVMNSLTYLAKMWVKLNPLSCDMQVLLGASSLVQ